jgi:ArsR family transcriptional regulator
MDLISIYQCFCDRTRLRILQLLAHGPLCVCHFQEILNEPQVKISKHLAYLRARRMVETRREGNFIIYAFSERMDSELDRHLQCLQDSIQTDSIFKSDLRKLRKIQKSCCKKTADLPRDRRALIAAQ